MKKKEKTIKSGKQMVYGLKINLILCYVMNISKKLNSYQKIYLKHTNFLSFLLIMSNIMRRLYIFIFI